MKQHEVQPSLGARKSKIRRGRGDSSGYGSFSGRGCKGQNSRAGGGVRLGFEGGQTPLWKRMPKLKGFKNPCRTEYTPVNIVAIEKQYEAGETVNEMTLLEKKIIRTTKNPIKILGNGTLTKKLSFEGVFFSASAKQKIQASGSSLTENAVAAE